MYFETVPVWQLGFQDMLKCPKRHQCNFLSPTKYHFVANIEHIQLHYYERINTAQDIRNLMSNSSFVQSFSITISYSLTIIGRTLEIKALSQS